MKINVQRIHDIIKYCPDIPVMVPVNHHKIFKCVPKHVMHRKYQVTAHFTELECRDEMFYIPLQQFFLKKTRPKHFIYLKHLLNKTKHTSVVNRQKSFFNNYMKLLNLSIKKSLYFKCFIELVLNKGETRVYNQCLKIFLHKFE